MKAVNGLRLGEGGAVESRSCNKTRINDQIREEKEGRKRGRGDASTDLEA